MAAGTRRTPLTVARMPLDVGGRSAGAVACADTGIDTRALATGPVTAGSRRDGRVWRAAAAATPFDALLSGAAAATAYFLAHPHYLRMELTEGLAWADERSSRSATWRQSIDIFVKAFQRCIADGSARSGDPLAYARALMAILQSQLAHWILSGQPADHDRVVADVTALIRHA